MAAGQYFNEMYQGESVRPPIRRTFASAAPAKCESEPALVILTRRHFNLAYYEHSFLACLMGVEPAAGADLFVEGGFVWMRTAEGRKKGEVIYRRIDDTFFDPLCFRPDSMLGVPGAGVADDKANYTFVPEMIRFHPGKEPVLQNIPTWHCAAPAPRRSV